MAYIQVEASVRTHRKMLAAGPAASWLWLCGLGYCQDGFTDGFIPEAAVEYLGVRDAGSLVETLVQVGLWDRVEGGWRVHDYLEHNKSASSIRETMRKRKAGGGLGGRPKTSAKTTKVNLGENPTYLPTYRPAVPPTELVAARPPGEPPDSVMVFPVIGKGPSEWHLTAGHVAELAGDYPGLDVAGECRRARAWCMANPTKRKTAGGMAAFLVSWMNREVREGGALRRPTPAKATHRPLLTDASDEDWFEVCQTLHQGQCTSRYTHGLRMARERAS